MKQYFSKLYNKWVELKASDCEKSLRKCGYMIREKISEDESAKLYHEWRKSQFNDKATTLAIVEN